MRARVAHEELALLQAFKKKANENPPDPGTAKPVLSSMKMCSSTARDRKGVWMHQWLYSEKWANIRELCVHFGLVFKVLLDYPGNLRG